MKCLRTRVSRRYCRTCPGRLISSAAGEKCVSTSKLDICPTKATFAWPKELLLPATWWVQITWKERRSPGSMSSGNVQTCGAKWLRSTDTKEGKCGKYYYNTETPFELGCKSFDRRLLLRNLITLYTPEKSSYIVRYSQTWKVIDRFRETQKKT